ncbi:hypothetical protein O181_048637 [Austropuccinia psidii MF-1]|uniref:Uncharacterized protein n=1 Tax=Austropuccinia psidii MF-1 TaxID=1389203 RepID=A0A9Q3E091_9BASI|nr:hypothetical protein [Austropuccinia psidii MF-1]
MVSSAVMSPDGSSPMDLDAVTRASQPASYFRRLCLSRGIFYDCLQSYTPSHGSGPNHTFPNPKTSEQENNTFIHFLSTIYSQPTKVSVEEVDEEIPVVADTEIPSKASRDSPLGVYALSMEENVGTCKVWI